MGLVGAATICISPEQLEFGYLASFLEPAGELLELTCGSKTYLLLNVTECIDALDADHTTYKTTPLADLPLDGVDEETLRILARRPRTKRVVDPVFALDRLGWQLFKVPQTAIREMYYWERSEDDEAEQFRLYCERNGLLGLSFEFIYATESSS
jgi:hypothetical protein